MELQQPVDDGFGDETIEIPDEMANRTKALGKVHPPTNPNIIISIIEFWSDKSGYNDPIVKSASSWLCYLLNDEVGQYDAGMTSEQTEELQNRLEELGLTAEQ